MTATREFETTTIPLPGTFALDITHTSVAFTVKHLMVSKVRGHFQEFDGVIIIAENPLESTATASIKVASITTNQAQRDEHLRSADFFLAEQYPEMTFESRRIENFKGGEFTLVGELTIRGVSKEVELQVELNGVAASPFGTEVLGFEASTEINREDFGLTWNSALESGGVLVGTKIKISIDGEAVRQV